MGEDQKFFETPDAYVLQGRDDEDDDAPREGELREQDRFLPIFNISKVMKKVVPPSGKVAKEARECVQECVSEFISFITSEASERCQAEKRKTINGEDILFAMSSLGFDNYIEPLKVYLQKYREAMKGDRQMDDLNQLGTEIMPGQLQSLTADGEVLLTYPNQQFSIG
eukprot:TRINITY_DN10552_c0_g1_i2.p1 TRINITY_DN10552_c0_g1~~TRINITY_DN10552_c0_g1_i2.p1  ORF type:complete len:168 (+),score=51.33 TRINITY_DN10552_c0_g1_i2:61-564(+)